MKIILKELKPSTDFLKSELKNYNYYISERDRLILELSKLVYRLKGVSGVRFDRQPSSSNNINADMPSWYWKALEDKENMKLKLAITEYHIKEIEDYISTLEDEMSSIIKEVYIEKRTLTKVADKHNYTISGIQWKIDSSIYDYLSQKKRTEN